MRELKQWLEALGLAKYATLFAEHEIDQEILAELSEQDLKELGIPLGPRRKLLKAIAALSSGDGADASAARPAARVFIPPQGAPEAERRQLTVMFCDLAGSTAMSVKLDPEELRDVIRHYQDCCGAIIRRFEGNITRYMGDGMLVFFGYPRAHENDAEHAVRAGLEIIDAVRKLDTQPDITLQTRIGIATGEVVVGDLIGEGAAQEHAVVGTTPNLAARLQSLAEPDSVVIADTTRRLVGGLFDCVDLGGRALKGFDEPVGVWRVGGERVVESRFEAFHPVGELTPLVGREGESDTLYRCWEKARDGKGQVALVSGEAGIGKSRLSDTLRKGVSAEPHVLLRYFCVAYHEHSVLYPVISQLERAAGFSREEPAGTKLDKLEAVLAQAVDDLSEVAPLLAALLSISVGDRYPPLNLGAARQKQKTLEVFEKQLAGLARKRPVLVFFEDLHWVDPTTLELIVRLIERVKDLPVLLLLTARPEFVPSWPDRRHVTVLKLDRLNADASAALVHKVTGGKALPAELMRHIVGKTDGVPLFVEELTKTVLESGLLQDRGDRFVLTGPLPPLALPSTLQDSLMARLDRLAAAKEIAQIGAIIGRHFPYNLLASVSPVTDAALRAALGQLLDAELIYARGSPPNATYFFKHALIQDTAYASLLRGKRRTLHASIADALVRRFPETAQTEPELVAHHYTEAAMSLNAIPYWHLAGKLAASKGAHTEAIQHLQRALGLLTEIPEGKARDEPELGLQVSLGHSLAASRGYAFAEVEKTYQRARELCQRLGETTDIFPILRGLFQFHLVRGELGTAQELAEQCVALARKTRNAVYLMEAYMSLAYGLCYRGDLEGSREVLEECLALYEAHRSEKLVFVTQQDAGVASYALLAMVQCLLGYPDQGLGSVRTSLALATELNEPFSLAYAYTWAAIPHELWGRLEKAAEYAERAVQISTQHGFDIWILAGTIHAAIANGALRESQENIERLKSALSAWQAGGAETFCPYSLGGLAEAYRVAGKLDEALEAVGQALAHSERYGEHFYDAALYRLRGELLVDLKSDAAETDLLRAVEVARNQKAKALELAAIMSLYRLRVRQGRGEESRRSLREITEWFSEGLDTTPLREARALLAKIA